MATNVFQNTSLVTNEFMFQLKNALEFILGLNTDYAGRFTSTMKAGESIKVRKPPIYLSRTGEVFSAGDMEDQFCTMTVQTTSGVDLELTNREQMFNFTSLRDQVIAPAAHTLANAIEAEAMSQAVLATYNFVGVPGTTPTSLETYNTARAIMFDNSAPTTGQDRLIINATMGVKTNSAGQALFNPTGLISDSFRMGFIGKHARADVIESQVLKTLTTGPYGGTPAVNGANQTGASIITDGWTSSAAARVTAGDILTFVGVNEVNRWTKVSTGRLKHFVVTANTSSDGSGNATIPISPSIVVTGPYQNVSGSPADSALISIYDKAQADQAAIASTASPQGIRYHRNAFLFASFDQPLGDGGVISTMTTPDPDSSIRVRFMKGWDIDNNKQKYRFDVVWAFGVAYPELAVRIAS